MHRTGNKKRLYSTDYSILPFRWENLTCCSPSCPDPDLDDLSANLRLGRDTKVFGKSINFPTVRCITSDGEDDAPCASLRDAKLNLAIDKGFPDCSGVECPQEVAALVVDKDGSPDWQAEKIQWMRAAGVSTPSELEGKLEDMRRAAAQNETDMKELACHVAEVRRFLLQLHDFGKCFGKRKRRCERLGRRKKRSRQPGCAATEFSCASSTEIQDSSSERAPKQARESLLDPQIMRSFGTLIKSPTCCN